MKKLLALSVMSVFLAGGLGTVSAHMKKEMTAQERTDHINKKVEKMTKELNLTSDQQSSVRQAIETKMNRAEEAKKEMNDKIKSVLKAEQLQKYEKMKED